MDEMAAFEADIAVLEEKAQKIESTTPTRAKYLYDYHLAKLYLNK